MKILLFDFNNILVDVEEELRRRGHTILPHTLPDGSLNDWKKADVIVVWQESDLGGWRTAIKKFQKAKIPVILMQHGRRGVSRIHHPFNEKLLSDKLCVWGPNDVTRMTACGVPREKIHVTGTPILSHIKPRIPHKGFNIAFSPEHWDQEVPENFAVRNALRKYVNKWHWKKRKVITKILEGEHDPNNYDNPVISNRMKPGHLDIAVEVLRHTDVVVSCSEGTFELLAQIMGIPVIIADIWVPKAQAGDERYMLFQREFSDACVRVKSLDNLGQAIDDALSNPQHLRAEREQIAILDGGLNIKDPVSEIVTVIENEKVS